MWFFPTQGKTVSRWSVSVAILLLFCVVAVASTLLLSRPDTQGRTGSGRRARLVSSLWGSGSSDSGEVDVAYFIQVSATNLPLLPRLIKVLHHPRNVYAVHCDRKMDAAAIAPVEAAIRANAAYAKNVRFMKREVVTYRGISMVLNVLSAMETLLAASTSWAYFINISASDYPLVAPIEQRRLLASPGVADAQANFASVSVPPKWVAHVAAQRIGKIFVDTALAFEANDTRIITTRQPNPAFELASWTPHKSEAWMVLHRSYVEHVVRSPAARRLLVAFGMSIEASEHFFVTLLANTARFRRSLVANPLRLVVWYHRGVKARQHPFWLDDREANASATVDGSTDGYVFADRLSSTPAWFARKFRVPDSPLLDALDRTHSGIQLPADVGEADAVAAASARVRDAFAAALAKSRASAAAWEARRAAAAAAGVLPDKIDRTPLDPEVEGGGGEAHVQGSGTAGVAADAAAADAR